MSKEKNFKNIVPVKNKSTPFYDTYIIISEEGGSFAVRYVHYLKKYFRYILISVSDGFANRFETLYDIENTYGFDHSSLSKLINNTKYKTIGGGHEKGKGYIFSYNIKIIYFFHDNIN